MRLPGCSTLTGVHLKMQAAHECVTGHSVSQKPPASTSHLMGDTWGLANSVSLFYK